VSAADRRFEATALFDVMDHAERYNDHILAWMLDFARPADRVLDFGAGTGRFAASLAERGFDVTCVEPDPGLRAHLAGRGLRSVAALDALGAERFDYCVSVNVLEHLPDDDAALRALRARLAKGGRALVYVPAFPLLWTLNDTFVGHQRRYRRESLAASFRAAGFAVDDVRYVDSLGFLAALVYRLLGRGDGAISPRSVELYDRLAFPLSRQLDRVLHRAAGKNLLVRARCA